MRIGTSRLNQISPCPVCENRLFRKLFSKKGRDFWKCGSCGFEMQFPLPSLEKLKEYYDESYVTGMYKTFVEAREMKRLTAQRRIKEILPYSRRGRWLDVGCSDGVFVETAREKGIDCEGIDFSEKAVAGARELGRPVLCGTVEDYRPDYHYDSVTGFDVVEHVIDPIGFLMAIHRLLVPGGRVCLSAPNQGSMICKIMGKRWYFYIPEEHLQYFNPSTLGRLLSGTGFEVVQCARTLKPLTMVYSLSQFKEYNPSIYFLLKVLVKALPRRLVEYSVPLYIGEMMVIAERRDGGN